MFAIELDESGRRSATWLTRPLDLVCEGLQWMTLGRNRDPGFVIEERPEGKTFVVTGKWTQKAERALTNGGVDGLDLNYARGFAENDLQFLGNWPVKRLLVLDRTLTDLSPIARLASTLGELHLQPAPNAKIDLEPFKQLTMLSANWKEVSDTISHVRELRHVIVLGYGGVNLSLLSSNELLETVVLKVAARLESLDSVADFPGLSKLSVMAAPRFRDVADIAAAKGTLLELEFEQCRRLDSISGVEELQMLRWLGISDCRDIDSIRPLASLRNLEVLYAWGNTRIVDGDLSPLSELPHLREVRMRDRREYRPRLTEVRSGSLIPQ